MPCLENEQDVADGDWTNPFRDWDLNGFLAWGSAVKTFSKAANQCHFVPCPENEQDVVDGDWANLFRDWDLNDFWAWGSAMKTFSNVANQCHFVPCPENEHEANAIRERFPNDPTWLAYCRFADPMAQVEPLHASL